MTTVAVPVHFNDERYGETACARSLRRKAHTTAETDVTCELCRQILKARARTAVELADGTFWKRFA